MVEIAPGVPIFILDAHGTEHPAIACSGITKTHPRGFPIVWVTGDVFRDDNPVPWPAENVRLADAHQEVIGDGTGTALPTACDHWAHTATDGIPRGSSISWAQGAYEEYTQHLRECARVPQQAGGESRG